MSGVRPIQQCAICGAVQPLSARTCSLCGARLPGKPTLIVPMSNAAPSAAVPPPSFDPAQGDDDLYAGDLVGRLQRWLVIGGIVLVLAAGIGVAAALLRHGGGDEPSARVEALTPGTFAPANNLTLSAVTPPRSTAAIITPMPGFATVTPAPPTSTDTPLPSPSPTQGPCQQTAGPGDTVYGMAIRCGHRDLAVVEVILEMNDMTDATQLREGQTLDIPWPTPTPGGITDTPPADGTAAPTSESETASGIAEVNEFGTPNLLTTYQAVEPTLRPGLAWHTVAAGETIIAIIAQYNTNADVLKQINPELSFIGCDFGQQFGGPTCNVMLYEGQRIRVPVPLPTMTLTPSPEGTLTPTPTATATFNAPFLLSPEDEARFRSDQIVVLRWGGTGTLGPNERYLVRVLDMKTGQTFTALVRDTKYELPGGWQPSGGVRHTFEWTISVVTVDAQNNVVSESRRTEPRWFTWDSR